MLQNGQKDRRPDQLPADSGAAALRSKDGDRPNFGEAPTPSKLEVLKPAVSPGKMGPKVDHASVEPANDEPKDEPRDEPRDEPVARARRSESFTAHARSADPLKADALNADGSAARIIPLYADRGPIPIRLPRPIMVRAFQMPAGTGFTPHSHAWGQLAYASEGITLVRTLDSAWTVPPAQAVWIPPRIEHDIKAPITGAAFRSVYLDPSVAESLGTSCRVLQVPRLLRELITHAARIPVDYDETGPDGRLMQVLLDQILGLQDEKPLHLPMPQDPRLRRLVDLLMQNPGDSRSIAVLAQDVGASARTLARRFVDETGLSLGDWRRRLKVVSAVERLSAGAPVTTVALDLGYESPSAFIAMFRKTVGCTPTAYLSRDADKT